MLKMKLYASNCMTLQWMTHSNRVAKTLHKVINKLFKVQNNKFSFLFSNFLPMVILCK